MYIQELFRTKEVTYIDDNEIALEQPGFNTIIYGLNSYSYKVTNIWNHLPNDIKSAIALIKSDFIWLDLIYIYVCCSPDWLSVGITQGCDTPTHLCYVPELVMV